eukprot:3790943-Amphidinium_carterae.1
MAERKLAHPGSTSSPYGVLGLDLHAAGLPLLLGTHSTDNMGTPQQAPVIEPEKRPPKAGHLALQ